MNQVSWVPGRYGNIGYWQGDTVISPVVATYGEWFESEVDVFRLYCGPGDTVVDVGANIGTHTMALASLVGPKGRVVSIEPQRPMFMLLCANAVLNNYLQVEPFRAVAGSTCRRMNYARVDYDQPQDSGSYQTGLMAALAPGNINEALDTVTLDYLACHKAKFIKIDVEGAEADVIKGAEQGIKMTRPVLYFENNRLPGSKELIAYVRSLDYKLYWHMPPVFNPDNFAHCAEIIHKVGIVYAHDQYWVNGVSMNMLGVPKGKQLPLPPDVIEVGSDDEHPCLPQYQARLLPNFKMLRATDADARAE